MRTEGAHAKAAPARPVDAVAEAASNGGAAGARGAPAAGATAPAGQQSGSSGSGQSIQLREKFYASVGGEASVPPATRLFLVHPPAFLADGCLVGGCGLGKAWHKACRTLFAILS
jgi:hypothetical protein